jgi:hypothetical protein
LNCEQSPDSKCLILFTLKYIRTNKVWNLRGCTVHSDARTCRTCWFARKIDCVIINRPIIRSKNTYWVPYPVWNTWFLARCTRTVIAIMAWRVKTTRLIDSLNKCDATGHSAKCSNSTHVIRVIKSGNIRREGRVTFMGEIRGARKVLMGLFRERNRLVDLADDRMILNLIL